MKILKSIAVAFSMYSRIPMPHFNWDSEDMKYHLIFFPFVGAVIGGLEYLLYFLTDKYKLSNIVFAIIAILIPLVVTGGFHMDGYMDVEDALSSWQTKEKRLEILKDPHIGAFSVINLVTAGLIYLAALIMMSKQGFIIWCFAFFVARCFSGICVVSLKKAKDEGLLHTESKTASQKIVFACICIELVIAFIIAGSINFFYTFLLFAIIGFTALIDMSRARKHFGGITGDVMGWFVVNAQMISAALIACVSVAI